MRRKIQNFYKYNNYNNLKNGDKVIENPKFGTMGYVGEIGTIIDIDDSNTFIVYNVKFNDGSIQEYHDDEIQKYNS